MNAPSSLFADIDPERLSEETERSAQSPSPIAPSTEEAEEGAAGAVSPTEQEQAHDDVQVRSPPKMRRDWTSYGFIAVAMLVGLFMLYTMFGGLIFKSSRTAREAAAPAFVSTAAKPVAAAPPITAAGPVAATPAGLGTEDQASLYANPYGSQQYGKMADSETDQRLDQMGKRIEGLVKGIDEIRQTLTTQAQRDREAQQMKAEWATVQQNLASIVTEMQAQKEQQQQPQQRAAPVLPPPAPVAEDHESTAPAARKTGARSARTRVTHYRLQALQGDRAWIREGKGKVLSVSVGDQIPGGGTVIEVNDTEGRVVTTQYTYRVGR